MFDRIKIIENKSLCIEIPNNLRGDNFAYPNLQ